MTGFRVVIPSYHRADGIAGRTLAALASAGIPAASIDIWVADEAERDLYARTVPGGLYRSLRVGAPGIAAARRAVTLGYPRGERLLFCDDDLDRILTLDGTGEKPKLADCIDLTALATAAFDYCAAQRVRLWGIAPAANAFFMRDEMKVGLYFTIGSLYGMVNDRGDATATELNEKDDYERSIRCFLADSGVARVSLLTVKSTYYRGGGGMVETRTVEAQESAVQYLERQWPQFVRRNPRRKSPYPEIRLALPPRAKMM